jgi:signal transduction histidine kinase
MKVAGRRLDLTVLLGVVLFALLPILAFLQYRWLGRISEAEHQKMLESLKRDTGEFCKDFDLEITRAFMTFAITYDASVENKIGQYNSHFNRWLKASKNPELVKSVWDVESHNGQWDIYKYDPSTQSLEPSQWPIGLHGVQHQLTAVQHQLMAVVDSDWSPLQVVPPDPAEPTALPSLIVPRRLAIGATGGSFTYRARVLASGSGPGRDTVLSHLLPRLKGALEANYSDRLNGFTIVEFDQQYLTKRFIPQLAEQRFGGKSSSEYALTILQRDSSRVVYQSHATKMNWSSPKGDATGIVFDVKPDEMPDLIKSGQSISGPPVSAMILQTTERFPLPRGASEAPEELPGAEKATESTPQGIWEVVVRHKAGSLEAAVAATRRKNLAISFGVLILLGSSIAILLTSTHKARRLARRQVQFVAGISHEFRTPLAVICSAGENLSDGIIESAAQVKAYGKLIESEGKRLTAMMEQMLQFAGVQSGRQPPSPKPVDAADAISRALAGCHPLIAEGGFTVEKQIDPDLPRVLAVPDALVGSIQNLLSNAIKYAGSERWIGVRASSAAGLPPEVYITIQDRGIGIPSAELASVFKPFYRGKRALAAQIHGNGLGLNLVKHYVESAGGRVTVSSSPDHGTAFTLHLPVAVETVAIDRQNVDSPCQNPERALTDTGPTTTVHRT